MKNISFLSENFQILGVKLSIYLNRCVFVMKVKIRSRIFVRIFVYSFQLFVLRFYGPVNLMGHVERGQFT